MHERLHVFVSERFALGFEIDECSLSDCVAMIPMQTDVLIDHVDWVAMSEITEKHLRISPTGGNGTDTVRAQIYGVRLRRLNDRSTMILQVARVTSAAV